MEQIDDTIMEIGTLTDEKTPFDTVETKKTDIEDEVSLPEEFFSLLDGAKTTVKEKQNESDIVEFPEKFEDIKGEKEQKETSRTEKKDEAPDQKEDTKKEEECGIEKPEGMDEGEFVGYKLNKELKSVILYTLPEEPIVEYLNKKSKEDPELAAGIVSKEKTLKACVKYVMEQATEMMSNRRHTGLACLPDQEVFKMVDTYYKTPNKEIERIKKEKEANEARKRKEKTNQLTTSRKKSITKKKKKEQPALPLEILAGDNQKTQENKESACSKDKEKDEKKLLEFPEIGEEHDTIDLVTAMNE